MPATSDHSRAIRVLILPSWYPTARYPVGGIFIQEQARALASYGQVSLSVLFIDRAPVREWLTGRKGNSGSREHSIRVVRLAMPRLPGIWPLLYVVYVLVAFWRLTREGHKPDLVHAHVALPAGLAGLFIKTLWHVPLVLSEHTAPFSALMRNPVAALVTRVVIGGADRVIAVSAGLRSEILAYPALQRAIDVVPNVVNVEAFGLRQPRVDPHQTVRILFVGEMQTSRKGVDYLIGALSILRKGGHDVRLDMVGDGRNRRAYETLARRLKVADLCTFHGWVEHERLARFMPRFDLFVLPSLAETFGVVLIEALACGIPVVATRSGGPEHIITPDVGVLVEPANSQALARGIEDALGRLSEFSPEHLRQLTEERYGQRSVSDMLNELYLRAAKAKA